MPELLCLLNTNYKCHCLKNFRISLFEHIFSHFLHLITFFYISSFLTFPSYFFLKHKHKTIHVTVELISNIPVVQLPSVML